SPAIARTGLVTVDPQHAHQLALDRFAQNGLAIEDWVFELDHANALADHLPARRPLPETVITDRGPPILRCQSGRHLTNKIATRCDIKKRCNLLKDLALAIQRCIETQLDSCRDLSLHRGSDNHTFDLRCEKGASNKAPAQQAVRLGE